jgi:hypothetical protein
MIQKISGLILLFILVAAYVKAQLHSEQKDNWTQMHQSKKPALQEFNEAKFGLFIHWCLYSELAGEWKGHKIPDLSEWIQYHAMIPKADYGKMELCFEGHHRWDLVRTNRFVQVLNASGRKVKEANNLFPVPDLEILANPNLEQNPGY